MRAPSLFSLVLFALGLPSSSSFGTITSNRPFTSRALTTTTITTSRATTTFRRIRHDRRVGTNKEQPPLRSGGSNNNNDPDPSERHTPSSFVGTVPNKKTNDGSNNIRRSLLGRMLLAPAAAAGAIFHPATADAAVGSLPELADTNAVLRGLTINVADLTQQQNMIAFLENSFDFLVLRQRRVGDVTDTWLGFGPEQLSVPPSFTIPVSSFSEYGGHASLHLRYDSKSTSVFYKGGETPPGDSIAYLQLGVPSYRISQMTKTGGSVIDAFGFVNVVSPAGLPIRAIVGINPDPVMFVAVNCADVVKSRDFYEQLGLVEQPYPYARLAQGTSPFEPPQPKKSVYLSHTANSMGILLLPSSKSKRSGITPNPVLQSLDIVYTPSSTTAEGGEGGEEDLSFKDPSGVPISFTAVDKFEKEEVATRADSIGI